MYPFTFSLVPSLVAILPAFKLVKLKAMPDGRQSHQTFLPSHDRDYFVLLKIVLIMGVVYWEVNRLWKRVCWYLMHLLAVVQYCILMMQAAITLAQTDDLFLTTWWITIVFGYNTCVLYVLLFNFYFSSPIQQSMKFINQQCSHSKDPEYDVLVRNKFHKTVRKACSGLLFLTFCIQLVMIIPSKQRDAIVRVPDFFALFGSTFVYWTNLCIHELYAALWICRIYFCTITFASLLAGLRAELHIIASNYSEILAQVQLETKSKICKGPKYQEEDDKLFWTSLNQQVQSTVDQHVELLRNVSIIKPSLEMAFLVMYIRMIVCLGLMSFIVVNSGISSATALILPPAIGYLAECYWACRLVDSFQDVNDHIMKTTFEVCAILPYSKEHHANYIKMRNTLMIINHCTSNSIRINCGGFFLMSSRVFLRVINTSYTVITFLWQMR